MHIEKNDECLFGYQWYGLCIDPIAARDLSQKLLSGSKYPTGSEVIETTLTQEMLGRLKPQSAQKLNFGIIMVSSDIKKSAETPETLITPNMTDDQRKKAERQNAEIRNNKAIMTRLQNTVISGVFWLKQKNIDATIPDVFVFNNPNEAVAYANANVTEKTQYAVAVAHGIYYVDSNGVETYSGKVQVGTESVSADEFGKSLREAIFSKSPNANPDVLFNCDILNKRTPFKITDILVNQMIRGKPADPELIGK
jgi:hypothetical protein